MSVRVVCVGAGWVTANRHIPALKRDRRAEVIGVIDTHEDRARELAERHRLAHWSTDLDAPWVREAECATVGTPPTSHHAIVTSLLDRGLHVLCEKPLAMTPDQAEAMNVLAEKRGRVLAVVHNFQFSQGMMRTRRLIDSGALGDLVSVYALQLSNPRRRLPTWYRSLPGGLFYDEAPHLLYLLRGLLGELESPRVTARVLPSEGSSEIMQLDAIFPHPVIWAQLAMNFAAPVSEWQLLIAGTRQLVAVDIFRDLSVVVPNDGRHEARDVLRTTMRGVSEHVGGVVRSGIGHMSGRLLYGNVEVASRFLDAVQTGRRADGISGRDGLAVVQLLHGLLERAQA